MTAAYGCLSPKWLETKFTSHLLLRRYFWSRESLGCNLQLIIMHFGTSSGSDVVNNRFLSYTVDRKIPEKSEASRFCVVLVLVLSSSSWFLNLDSWFLILDSWFLVLGSWFLVLGSWFLRSKFCVRFARGSGLQQSHCSLLGRKGK